MRPPHAPPAGPDLTGAQRPTAFHLSRRTFLHRCALLAAATGLPSWFVERQMLAAAEPAPRPGPNDRPGVALIGCGGMGNADARNARTFGDIVAVCDVDATRLAQTVEAFRADGRAPASHRDFRRVLERDDVDVIINGTPDHWHTLINIAAARAGKDIYSEKPLTLTFDEGRHVIAAVRRHGVVLQTGTQQRSSQRFHLVCELVRNNRLGRLKTVDIWLPAGLREGPFASAPVPEGLDWDFWLGQAPKVAYTPNRCHLYFRYWWDYSGGTLTDWGAHHLDIVRWALGATAPRTIEGTALSQPVPGGYTAIAEYEIRYAFANDVQVRVRTTKDDSIYGEAVHPEGQRNGIRFEGTDGWIWVNRAEIEASERDLVRTPLPEGAERLPVSRNHMANFFECVRTRALPICDVETGHRSAALCHLGAIALRTGGRLEWDDQRERFTGANARAANRLLARRMRRPYGTSFAG